MTTLDPREPTLATLENPALRYVMATRPAFLSVTFVGGALGLASAYADGLEIAPLAAVLTIVFALVAHAGANVINDYYDSVSHCDALNHERVFPFTGGSRFIQNGVLSEAEVKRYGYALLALVVPPGLWLTGHSARGLLMIGAAGLALGWAYSAPPLRLQGRGVGELAITLAWTLVVVGADFVQRGRFSFTPVVAGLGFALLVANVLFINQFPDRRADAAAGKRTVVVRLGPARARWGYLALATLSYGWVAAMIALRHAPLAAAVSLAPAAISFAALRGLWSAADQPQRLPPAIQATILAAVAQGVLMALAIAWAR